MSDIILHRKHKHNKNKGGADEVAKDRCKQSKKQKSKGDLHHLELEVIKGRKHKKHQRQRKDEEESQHGKKLDLKFDKSCKPTKSHADGFAEGETDFMFDDSCHADVYDPYSSEAIDARSEKVVDIEKACKHLTHKSGAKKERRAEKDKVQETDAVDKEFSGHREGNEIPDHSIDFTKFKHSLNRIFFRDQDMIQRGSKEYEDFWVFLDKYQQYQKTAGENATGSGKVPPVTTGALNIPCQYDRHYRINLRLMSRDLEDFLKKGRLIDYDVDRELTREQVRQFRSIVQHYLDFSQKQKFQKLTKIRCDQKNLPIYQYRNKIVATIHEQQVVVVAGDTGCGKSTQVPQYLLEAGFTKIACTQPRRIACISLAKRVSYETLNEYGSQVAFQVRFEKSKTSGTMILFLTEGLLLRQMSTDPLLSQYSVIVIDEVHERHIHTDFLLGVLKCLLKIRPDLKLVLMSATINISLFSAYFEGAPVIKVPGRLYPIQMEYCPFNKGNEMYSRPERLDPTPYIRIMQRIDSKYPATERGDLLIFVSGMTEIMTVVDAARLYAQQVKRWIILPLHSALSVEEQEKVFDYPPAGVRKCIVSTNIAETSVTIDGVRFVVDSGKVKEMSFDPKYKMQRLKEFWVSRASAEQRKGRAGRTGPGVCFRLYAESDYDEFQAYTTPEIQRVPLDSLILQLISMGLKNVRKFPFIEPPDMSSIENSINFLKEQGAVGGDESLTPIGQMLSMLPVDVVIGKMLIMGSIFHMTDPVLSIAAALSVQSPFTSKAHVDHDAIAARRSLESEHGDPLTLLNAFDEWIQVKVEGLGTRRWCRRRCLEEQRFYEMTKLKQQFKELLQDHRLLEKGGDQRQHMSSAERRQQHGERKRLHRLRHQQQQERKKRKVLRMEDEDFTVSDQEEEDKGADIKDLEFRLSHNLSQLQETSNCSRRLTLRDINLLKIILCSGIYPQVALADDCNSFKGDPDQMFHTKNKPFILLHPTSIFAYRSNLLKSTEVVEKQAGGPELKGHLSTKHELLAYGSLLETNNKPYLVNCMRLPALQTAALFGASIDTNTDCTRLVCDEWLEFRFKDGESGEQVLSSIICLRATWQKLLQLRLEDTFQSMDEDRSASPRALQLEQLLACKLAEFLDSSIPYTLRRILPAERQHLYIGPGQKISMAGKLLMFGQDAAGKQQHCVKGGIQVNDYLTFGCLLGETAASVWGEYTLHMERHWKCPHCGENMVVSIAERLHHEATCQKDSLATTAASLAGLSEETDKKVEANPFKKPFFCPDCRQHLNLTPTEVLRHKKLHAEGKSTDTVG